MKDLANYVDGKYVLHHKWERQALDRNIEIKLRHDRYAFSLDVARRLRSYFRSVSIDCIWTSLKTENVIDQECEDYYVFNDCRDANPQKLVVNAKLKGNGDLISFNKADGEVRISEITIGEYGSFDAIVRNEWWNCKYGDERKQGYYSLLLHAETLSIQNNPEAVCDLDSYISGNYKAKSDKWKVKKLSENLIVRVNGVSGLDEQIRRLKEYFGYIVIDGRKSFRDGSSLVDANTY